MPKAASIRHRLGRGVTTLEEGGAPVSRWPRRTTSSLSRGDVRMCLLVGAEAFGFGSGLATRWTGHRCALNGPERQASHRRRTQSSTFFYGRERKKQEARPPQRHRQCKAITAAKDRNSTEARPNGIHRHPHSCSHEKHYGSATLASQVVLPVEN